jgi:hypothetical protein
MIFIVLSLSSEEKIKISYFLSQENCPRISKIVPHSFFNPFICATLFHALHTVVGDGIRKKDMEIPPERAFI